MKFTAVLVFAFVAYLLFIVFAVDKQSGGHVADDIIRGLPLGKATLTPRVRNAMEDVRKDLVALEVVNPKDAQEVNLRTYALQDSWKRMEIDWPVGKFFSARQQIERTVNGCVVFADTFKDGYPQSDVLLAFARTVPDASKRDELLALYKGLAGGGSEAQSVFAKAVLSETSVSSARIALDAVLNGQAKE